MAVDQWWVYRPRITACDLLDAGACIKGVREAVTRYGLSADAMTNRRRDPEWVDSASNNSGDGDGYGSGYGSGSGDGSGYGYGYGSGYGEEI